MVKKEDVCARIGATGILPAIRVPSAEDALWVAGEMLRHGIKVVELTMTTPEAIGVISDLARSSPQLIVGAGTVLNMETARMCIDAGAAFITSPGFDPEVIEFTASRNVAAIPGALTPSEVMQAKDSGADMVKIYPCSAVGGPDYIRALRAPFPHVPIIASGGVDQVNAGEFIRAGAAALGIRGELIPPEAVQRRDQNWIKELAARFLHIVQRARAGFTHN